MPTAFIVLLPEVAAACATCVSSAFGDRSYNWAYLGLLVMPFVLTAVVGGIVAVRMGWRPLTPVKAWFGETSLFSDRSTRREDAPHLARPLPAKKHGGST